MQTLHVYAPFLDEEDLEEIARLAAIEKWCNHVDKMINNPSIIRIIQDFIVTYLTFGKPGSPFSPSHTTVYSVYDLFAWDVPWLCPYLAPMARRALADWQGTG